MIRRILITGASGGLGQTLALALARPGAELILIGRRTDALNSVADAVRSKGAMVQTHVLELSSADDVLAFGKAIASESAGLDVLIHNAAVIKPDLVAEADIADLDWHYQVNVKAPVILTKCLFDQLRRTRGQLVFINSAAGLVARKGTAFYAATKHALKAIADSLREELAPSAVTVLNVFPSRMNTPMQERVLAMEGAAANLNHFLKPEDTAEVIVQAMERCRRGEIRNVTLKLGETPRFE
ncbi:MAG TPA: SDR family NAD(P)-dependent oxidoreductase [Candidatus Udaeobacter sp.]